MNARFAIITIGIAFLLTSAAGNIQNYMLETFPDLANTSVITPFTVEEVREITTAHPKANARTIHGWRQELIGSEALP